MTPHYADEHVTLHHGDCLDVLRAMPDCSVDAVVTDPPYGLAFMGKTWDDHVDGRRFGAWCEQWATECLRVLKPGGHMLAFGGTRTWHRLTCGVEDAGFEIRDCLVWVYASGFPKSLDVAKAIDKAAGAEREVVGRYQPPSGVAWNLASDEARSEVGAVGHSSRADSLRLTAPATDAARQWQGWGTALKPAQEPILVARKPLAGTVAGNVQAWGTGALNIDGCRVQGRERTEYGLAASTRSQGAAYGAPTASADFDSSKGRWPSNLVLSHAATPDGADLCGDGCVDGCPVRELDRQSGVTSSNLRTSEDRDEIGATFTLGRTGFTPRGHADSGGASRFFPTFRYEPKAPTSERPRDGETAHPTVKPLDLMRWLVRLVTPPAGTVLEPFTGSGTTAEACVLEGFSCVAVEREASYLPLIVQRLSKPLQPDLFGGAA